MGALQCKYKESEVRRIVKEELQGQRSGLKKGARSSKTGNFVSGIGGGL